MGNSSQGTVISNQVQGVKSGGGIAIAADGTISVDSQSIVGVMKLGQTAATAAAAYNAYEWPTSTGTVGQQLTISVVGTSTTLAWDDPDGIPWTAKGQLVVGTGSGTQALLSVGTDGQILIADSTQATGLGYTSNFVATTGSTSTALIPAGSTAARPVSPATGAFRYNSSNSVMEFYNGTAWQVVVSSASGLFVEKTSATGASITPAGTTAQRDASPVAGYFRYNSSNTALEFYNGTVWSTVASSSTGLFVDKTSTTGAAIVPAGTTAQRDGSPVAGYFRYNSTNSVMEFYDGTAWNTVAASTTGLFVDKTSSTGSAALPAGTTLQRDASPATGYTRFNTTTAGLETWNGASWTTTGSGTVSSVTGTLPITVATGTTTPVIAINAATQALTGSIKVATTAEATTGTDVATALSPGTGVAKDAATMTGSAYIPAGTTAQRPTASTYTGQFRYNTTIPQLEYSDGTSWLAVGSGLSAATLAQAQAGTLNTVASTPQTAVPKDASGMTGSAFIPAGTTAQQPTASTYTGQLRYNTTVPQWEYSDGAAWIQLVSSTTLTAASLAEAAAGTVNTKYSSPETAVPKDASGMTGALLSPGGDDAARPASPVTGMVRYNDQGGTPATTVMEYWNGSAWTQTWGSGGGGAGSIQIFTSSGTYTPTAGKTSFLVFVAGGGGGGGSGGGGSVGGYGGPGATGSTGIRFYTSTEMGASATVTVGAGGSPSAFAGYPAAGTSSFNPAGTGPTVEGFGGRAGLEGGDQSLGAALYAEPGPYGGAGTANSFFGISGFTQDFPSATSTPGTGGSAGAPYSSGGTGYAGAVYIIEW